MKIDNALDSLKEADICFLGVPLAVSKTPNKLSLKAPDLLRFALNNKDDYNIISKKSIFDSLKIADLGNVSLSKLSKYVEKSKDKTFFVFGGEHTITKTIVDSLINNSEDFELVVFDSHLDMRKGFSTNACFMSEILEKLPKERIHLIGQKVYSEDEYNYLNTHGLMIEKDLSIKNKKIYISFDIDVLDDIYVPSASTPEPLGLSIKEAIELLTKLFRNNKIIGIDFVEFAGKNYDITYSNIASIVMSCLGNILK